MSKPKVTTWTITLAATADASLALRGLRALLKRALRDHGLKCVSITPVGPSRMPGVQVPASLFRFFLAHDVRSRVTTTQAARQAKA